MSSATPGPVRSINLSLAPERMHVRISSAGSSLSPCNARQRRATIEGNMLDSIWKPRNVCQRCASIEADRNHTSE